MNILFFSRLFYPHIGGVEKHVMEISKILIGNGNKVTVITEKIPGTQDKELIEGINIKRISVGKDNWFKKFRIWREIWRYRDLIINADVIHAHDIFFWYLPLRFIFPFRKVYATFHGYEGNQIPGFKAKFMHKIAEKLSNGNICVGDFLKKWYGTKPDYVTYGAVNKIQNSSRFNRDKIQNYNSKVKILFVGRLEEETGAMEYLKALKILKKKKYQYEIIILGDGSSRRKAENYAKSYSLNAKFIGFVGNVGKYFRNCDFVFVSRYLGILEAMSFKKFVFAVYNNEIKKDYLEMAPFSKFISTSKNSEDLSGQIEYYLKNDKKRNELNVRGFNWVKNETWEKMTSLYIGLWNKE